MLASGGTLLFSSPQSKENHHHNGVGLLLTKPAHKSLLDWENISYRIMRGSFHSRFQEVTIIQCNAPINQADNVIKEEFFAQCYIQGP